MRRFFEYMSVPSENITIMGESTKEIKHFESFVVCYMHEHKDDYGKCNEFLCLYHFIFLIPS
jgi:hypothetical protein